MSKDWWLFRQVLCPFSSWKYNTSSLTPVLACHRLADLHQFNYSQDTFSHKCVFWTTLECQWEHRQRNVSHWSCRRCFDRGATCVCVLYAGSCYVGAAIRDWAEFAGRWTRGLRSPHRASADPARRELLVEAVEQDTNLETVQQLGGRAAKSALRNYPVPLLSPPAGPLGVPKMPKLLRNKAGKRCKFDQSYPYI